METSEFAPSQHPPEFGVSSESAVPRSIPDSGAQRGDHVRVTTPSLLQNHVSAETIGQHGDRPGFSQAQNLLTSGSTSPGYQNQDSPSARRSGSVQTNGDTLSAHINQYSKAGSLGEASQSPEKASTVPADAISQANSEHSATASPFTKGLSQEMKQLYNNALAADRYRPRNVNSRDNIQKLLDTPGYVGNVEQVYLYKLHFRDKKQQIVVPHLVKKLHDEVYGPLIDPETAVQLDLWQYISRDDMLLLPRNGIRSKANHVFIRTSLVDSSKMEESTGKDLSSFTKVFDGYGTDGKPKFSMKRFEAFTIDDYQDEEKRANAERNVPGAGRSGHGDQTYGEESSDDRYRVPEYKHLANPQNFYLWFEREAIQLNDAHKLSIAAQDNKQQQRLDHIIGLTLRKELSDHGEDLNDIFMHGAKVFSKESSVLPSGLVERKGLKGGFTVAKRDTGSSTKVSYHPCSGLFFDKMQPVSDLLISFFGYDKAVKPNPNDTTTLKRMKNLLRGVEVLVPVQDGYGRQHRIIYDVAGSVARHPKALLGLKGNISISDLRYTSMPCIDVGEPGHPFYFPAELCRFTPNQMYHSEVPAVDRTDLFKVKVAKPKLDFKPKTGEEFADVGADDFKLFFINLTSARLSHGPNGVAPLRPEVWRLFQHEVGQRFGKKLEESVKESQHLQLELTPSNDDILAQITNATRRHSGNKTVLIITLPRDAHKSVRSDIKTHCETAIGVQSSFVTVKQLDKAYKAKDITGMVQYSSQIVRKIFGRANIPGKLETDQIMSTVSNDRGRVYGVNVISMQQFRPRNEEKLLGLGMKENQLVSIVSISTKLVRDRICTDHYAVRAEDGYPSLVEEVAKCLATHATYVGDTSKADLAKAAIFLSGLPLTYSNSGTAWKEKAMESALSNEIDKVIGRKYQAKKHLTLNIVSPQNQLTMDSASSSFKLDTESADVNNSKENDFELQSQTLQQVFRFSDGHRKRGGDLKEPSQLWHIVHKNFGSGVVSEYLEKRHQPEILYLAEAASERGQSYVYQKSDTNVGQPTDYEYGVRPIREELQGSLYYL